MRISQAEKILGISVRASSRDQILEAFRDLAKANHPDSSQAGERIDMAVLVEAKDTLLAFAGKDPADRLTQSAGDAKDAFEDLVNSMAKAWAATDDAAEGEQEWPYSRHDLDISLPGNNTIAITNSKNGNTVFLTLTPGQQSRVHSLMKEA